ncbi:AMP-binding dehydrogenase [Schizosaccharomyces cryophilus OY26]|uniref:AMP-binding dehydrogenase n=1 Tax=Schizosaccharomyces cryophilus (strain OY26 / ATCC MYA-4695 / CBS 11777 / NBRC 106824 / NRRL Y48691) TaxID=653667 RepID=S9W547_SCHCR|nr:AMP-binding dehydrogenase [Schizosaccharomyces cryophilus OY26]EPY53040.1 AMP-binding dehydrogenase [Schizosaccharomyces cryophilus OY26]
MSPKSLNTTSSSSILVSPREEDTPVARLLRNANETPDHRFIYVYNEYTVVAEQSLNSAMILAWGKRLEFIWVTSTIFALWATGRTCVILNRVWSQGLVYALVQRLDISDFLYHEYAPVFQVDSLNVLSFACLQTDLNVPCIRAGLEPQVALINHSSGSTGVSKSMPFLIKKYAFGYDYGTPDFMNHLFTPMVMAPSFALTTWSWLNALYCNGSLLYPSSSISSNRTFTSEAEHNLLGMSIMLFVLDANLVAAGGEMVPANMYHICKRVLPNAIIYPQYGTTESGLVSFFAPNGEDTLHNKKLVYFPGKTVKKLFLFTQKNELVPEKIGHEAFVIQEKSVNLSTISYRLLHEDACALARTIPNFTIMHTNAQYVLLTGATVYLGRRFLEYLLEMDMSVVCLIRDSSDKAAEERLTFIVWAAHLEETRFGLDNAKWDFLIKNVFRIYHMGAKVHWMKSYQELRPVNVLGTKTILELSVMGPKALYFISGGGQQEIELDDRIQSTKTSGYALSKYVSELLCKKVKDLGHPSIYVIRPGFIVASDGEILSRDFFWRFVISALRMGAYPQYSESQPLLFRISTTNALCIALTQIMEKQADEYAPLLAYDRIDGNEFAQICEFLKKKNKKLQFVSLDGWLKVLEKDIDEEGEDHPLFALQQTVKFALESGMIPYKGLKNIYPMGEKFLTKEAIANGLDNLYIE